MWENPSVIPIKTAHSCGVPGPHRMHGFFGPTRVNVLDSITIGSATFAGLMVVIDSLTDRQTVAIGRI